MTATTPQIPAAGKIQSVLRRQLPEARIILGGPHTTLVHAAFKNEYKRGMKGRATEAFQQLQQKYDVLVAGDGELAIFEALGNCPPKIIDGDTLHIGKYKIRLHGIDAPELNQNCLRKLNI